MRSGGFPCETMLSRTHWDDGDGNGCMAAISNRSWIDLEGSRETNRRAHDDFCTNSFQSGSSQSIACGRVWVAHGCRCWWQGECSQPSRRTVTEPILWPRTRFLERACIAMGNSAGIRAILDAVVGMWQPVWGLLSASMSRLGLFRGP